MIRMYCWMFFQFIIDEGKWPKLTNDININDCTLQNEATKNAHTGSGGVFGDIIEGIISLICNCFCCIIECCFDCLG